VWALVSLVSAVWSPYRAMGIVRGLQLVIAVLVVTAVARHATRADLHRFAHAYVVLCSLSVAVGLAFPFPRIERQASRFTWLYVHPVIAGTFCGLAAVIALSYLLTRARDDLPWRWPRGAYGALLAVNAVTVVATITRAAMAATALGCLAVALLISSTRRRVDLGVLAVAVTALVLLLFGDPLFEFLRRGQTEVAFRTLSARTVLWGQAWELFLAQPVLGYGLMATRGVFLEETGLGSAHNALLEVVINTGLVGSIAWLVIVGVVGWSLYDLWARSERHHLDVPLLVGVFVFLLVNGLSTEGPGLPANVQSAWLLAIAAWVGVLRRRARHADALPRATASARR
jgi:exopolysaccharide production protein ExoQ